MFAAKAFTVLKPLIRSHGRIHGENEAKSIAALLHDTPAIVVPPK
jgi:hypothetical protein